MYKKIFGNKIIKKRCRPENDLSQKIEYWSKVIFWQKKTKHKLYIIYPSLCWIMLARDTILHIQQCIIIAHVKVQHDWLNIFREKVKKVAKKHKLCIFYVYLCMLETQSLLVRRHHLNKASCEIVAGSFKDFLSNGGKSVKDA